MIRARNALKNDNMHKTAEICYGKNKKIAKKIYYATENKEKLKYFISTLYLYSANSKKCIHKKNNS